MSAPPSIVRPAEGQLANVDAIIIGIANPANAGGLAAQLATICRNVLLVGDGFRADDVGRAVAVSDGAHPLSLIAAGLREATAERVIVVADDVPPDETELLLALVAWPEADAVTPRSRDGRQHALCAIYRREVALAAAERRLAAGNVDLDAWLGALETDHLADNDLAAVLSSESGLR